jgi:hypothetical protein
MPEPGQLIRLVSHHTYHSLRLSPIGLVLDIAQLEGVRMTLVLTVDSHGNGISRWFSDQEIAEEFE